MRPAKSRIQYKLDDLLTVEQLAEALQVSVKTVQSWVYKKKVPYTKLCRRVYFQKGVVENLLSQNAVPPLRSGRSVSPSSREGGAADTEKGGDHG